MKKQSVLLCCCIILSGSAFAQTDTTKTNAGSSPVQTEKETGEDELEEVLIESTRASRSIKNTPSRIELIEGEEVDEKANMRPSNVSMLLHESTGIQVQQTSATSANAGIRLQGLDGRYAQLLKNGYPNFGNFASGLSVLEIPPLDLKQVEIIKGPASTLYGGGAISGVINFISKQPTEKGEYNLLLNQSNVGQSNVAAFAAKRFKQFGFSILAAANNQKAYDVDKDDFSELPNSVSFNIDPQIYFYPNEHNTIRIGNTFATSNIKGGDMNAIKSGADAQHAYFEFNETKRNTTTFSWDHKRDNGNAFRIKQSLSFFDRKIQIPSFVFDGVNTNAYTDVNYTKQLSKGLLIAGFNLVYDKFIHEIAASFPGMTTVTPGIYAQHLWDISDRVKLESGIRVDHSGYSTGSFKKDQTFVLPRVSALFKISDVFSSRIGGGLGYKAPTYFTEQTERFQYLGIRQLNNVSAEHSAGVTADLNAAFSVFDDLQMQINQMFFFTDIKNPLVLQAAGADVFFYNASSATQSAGFETNVRLIYKNFIKFFGGYTFTDARALWALGNQQLPLVAKHKLNLALIVEKEANYKMGLEGYFTGPQILYNQTPTPSFWEFGFMAEKTFKKKYSIYINFENFTDTRQSRYKRVVNGPHNAPTFDDIWTHTEGFTWNAGVKIKL